MRKKVEGKAWRFGANVDTDQIIPAEYLVTGDSKELARHAFERARPDFAGNVKTGDVIIADSNFGCGSSREHAPRALIGAGISCVIAASFARIFYRNSINIGLPLVECEVEADEGDLVSVDFERGVVVNKTKKREYSFKPLPPFLLKLIEVGGLVPYVRKSLGR